MVPHRVLTSLEGAVSARGPRFLEVDPARTATDPETGTTEARWATHMGRSTQGPPAGQLFENFFVPAASGRPNGRSGKVDGACPAQPRSGTGSRFRRFRWCG